MHIEEKRRRYEWKLEWKLVNPRARDVEQKCDAAERLICHANEESIARWINHIWEAALVSQYGQFDFPPCHENGDKSFALDKSLALILSSVIAQSSENDCSRWGKVVTSFLLFIKRN